MENWQLAIVLLLAVLVGTMIPVVILLSLGLSRLNKQVAETGKRVDLLLDTVQETVERVNRMGRNLEGSEQELARFMGTLGELSGALDKLKNVMKAVGSLSSVAGPALAAFMQTMRSTQDTYDGSAPQDDEAPGNKQGH